jgi:FMN phosphatase YigB (HAD superfamily)
MSGKYDLLILDYGGVYSFDYDPASFDQIMFSVFGKQPTEAEKEKILSVSGLLGTNEMVVEDYVNSVAEILTAQVPVTGVFEEATISHGFPPSQAMVQLVKTVREAGIKVSLLSDMYLFELEKTKAEGRYEGFDYTSFSSEIGYMKNSSEAFASTLSYFNVAPEKTLFVDDRPQFTQNAQLLGIDVILADKAKFRTAEQLAMAVLDQIRP